MNVIAKKKDTLPALPLNGPDFFKTESSMTMPCTIKKTFYLYCCQNNKLDMIDEISINR